MNNNLGAATAEGAETFKPAVTPVPGADAEWVQLGMAYWDWRGFNAALSVDERAKSLWSKTTKELAAIWGESENRLYILAAAGVNATLLGVECKNCEDVVLVRSRGSLDRLAEGEPGHHHCGRCNETLQKALVRLKNPATRLRRQEQKRESASVAQAALNDKMTEAAWRSAARATLQARVKPFFGEEKFDWEGLKSDFRTEFGVSAWIGSGVSNGLLSPLKEWDVELHPDSDKTSELASAAIDSGLLRVDWENAPLDGIEWSLDLNTFKKLRSQDPNAFTAPEFNGFYLWRVPFCAWQGPSKGVSLQRLYAHLQARTTAWMGTTQGQQDAIILAKELLVGESLKLLNNELAFLRLPKLNETQELKLRTTLQKAVTHYSLGEIYNLLWRASRSASTLSQSVIPTTPLKATSHAVNKVEIFYNEAQSSKVLKAYTIPIKFEPSVLSRALFMGAFGLTLSDSSINSAQSAMGAPTSQTLSKTEESEQDETWETEIMLEDLISVLADALDEVGADIIIAELQSQRRVHRTQSLLPNEAQGDLGGSFLEDGFPEVPELEQRLVKAWSDFLDKAGQTGGPSGLLRAISEVSFWMANCRETEDEMLWGQLYTELLHLSKGGAGEP